MFLCSSFQQPHSSTSQILTLAQHNVFISISCRQYHMVQCRRMKILRGYPVGGYPFESRSGNRATMSIALVQNLWDYPTVSRVCFRTCVFAVDHTYDRLFIMYYLYISVYRNVELPLMACGPQPPPFLGAQKLRNSGQFELDIWQFVYMMCMYSFVSLKVVMWKFMISCCSINYVMHRCCQTCNE